MSGRTCGPEGSHLDNRGFFHAVSAQHLVADLKKILGIEEWIFSEQRVGNRIGSRVEGAGSLQRQRFLIGLFPSGHRVSSCKYYYASYIHPLSSKKESSLSGRAIEASSLDSHRIGKQSVYIEKLHLLWPVPMRQSSSIICGNIIFTHPALPSRPFCAFPRGAVVPGDRRSEMPIGPRRCDQRHLWRSRLSRWSLKI